MFVGCLRSTKASDVTVINLLRNVVANFQFSQFGQFRKMPMGLSFLQMSRKLPQPGALVGDAGRPVRSESQGGHLESALAHIARQNRKLRSHKLSNTRLLNSCRWRGGAPDTLRRRRVLQCLGPWMLIVPTSWAKPRYASNHEAGRALQLRVSTSIPSEGT